MPPSAPPTTFDRSEYAGAENIAKTLYGHKIDGIVADLSVRENIVLGGDVAPDRLRAAITAAHVSDFADGLPAESYARIAESEAAEPVLLRPFGWPIFAINHKDGLLTDLNVRKALQAALPHDDMMFAAFGDDNFFIVDAPMYPEGWTWRNDAGTELYNQNDQARAAELLDAAGYEGTPLRILTSRQYEFHFKMAEVAKMALEAAGFAVQMDVVDWATLGQRRNDPALWDIYITHSPFLPEPALTSLYSATSRLGWAEPDKEATLAAFTTATDQAEREALFADLQKAVFEDVGQWKRPWYYPRAGEDMAAAVRECPPGGSSPCHRGRG